jgi:hypothetical protein
METVLFLEALMCVCSNTWCHIPEDSNVHSHHKNLISHILVACVKYMLCFLSVQDSFAHAIIPLKDDVALQEKYVTFKGYVRLGRLLEDMDIFAGEYEMVMYVQLKKYQLPVV